MKNEIIITICERHRESTENVRITGRTQAGETYTFYVVGENAWRFESFLKEGTQVVLSPVETYAVYYGTQENQRNRIPSEYSISIHLEHNAHA